MALTATALGRFPERLLPSGYLYGGVDVLILLGVARGTIVQRSVHRVYYDVLPAFIAGQAIVAYTVFHGLPYWTRIAHAILRSAASSACLTIEHRHSKLRSSHA